MPVGLKTTSSAGQQRKQLLGRYIVKYDNPNCREGLSEVLTSRFLDLCDIPFGHIRYTPYVDSTGAGCRCLVNTPMLESSCSVKHYLQRVNAPSLRGTDSFENLYAMILRDLQGIPDAEKYFKYLVWVDTVVQNVDRHWGNINIIIESKGLRLSPFFDFGASLSFDVPDCEYPAGICAGINKSRCSLLHSSFLETLRIVSKGNPVHIKFKDNKVKVDDLCVIYPEAAVIRALGIININMAGLGLNIMVQPR